MEECAEPAGAEAPSRLIFSQVIFIDTPHSYPPAAPVTCRYTVTTAFEPSNKDWVGIFKVRQQVRFPLCEADFKKEKKSAKCLTICPFRWGGAKPGIITPLCGWTHIRTGQGISLRSDKLFLMVTSLICPCDVCMICCLLYNVFKMQRDKHKNSIRFILKTVYGTSVGGVCFNVTDWTKADAYKHKGSSEVLSTVDRLLLHSHLKTVMWWLTGRNFMIQLHSELFESWSRDCSLRISGDVFIGLYFSGMFHSLNTWSAGSAALYLCRFAW